MLIGSHITQKNIVVVKLDFDDGTSKEQVIRVGTKVKIKYRYENERKEKIGIIKKVETLYKLLDSCDNSQHLYGIGPNDKWYALERPIVTFAIDCSDDYNADIIIVNNTDILDIELLEIDEKMELLNMYNDCKETIHNDENQYTEESFNYYTASMTMIKDILDNPERIGEVCNVARDVLNNAIMNLVPTDTSDEGNSDIAEGDGN